LKPLGRKDFLCLADDRILQSRLYFGRLARNAFRCGRSYAGVLTGEKEQSFFLAPANEPGELLAGRGVVVATAVSSSVLELPASERSARSADAEINSADVAASIWRPRIKARPCEDVIAVVIGDAPMGVMVGARLNGGRHPEPTKQ